MYLLENLTALMKERNINRSELAKAIGIAPSTINSWYNRSYENISLQTLLKLSRYFNISMESLVNKKPVNYVCFVEHEYTNKELEIIRQFGDFIKGNRINSEESTNEGNL